MDAIFDSVSVATTYREKLAEQGIIFVPLARRSTITRNWCVNISAPWCRGMIYFAALNAAVASDGTFIYVPKGVRCPMELSTYFRINAEKPAV